jgi:phosphate transport system protein
MSKHLERDLNQLTQQLLKLGGIVELLINDAMVGLINHRDELADKVLKNALEVDRLEVEIEEECLKILALHQPVAVDLRFLVVVLKVNNDLERIGDISENLAERAKHLNTFKDFKIPSEFIEHMAIEAKAMLNNSLKSLVNKDVNLANQVIDRDDVVDDLHRRGYLEIKETMKHNVHYIDPLSDILSISRYLERIADLSTNIAEDVIFMVEGDVVRHQDKF